MAHVLTNFSLDKQQSRGSGVRLVKDLTLSLSLKMFYSEVFHYTLSFPLLSQMAQCPKNSSRGEGGFQALTPELSTGTLKG